MNTFSAFKDFNLLAVGSVTEVLMAVKSYLQNGGNEPALFFDHSTGTQRDFDLTGDVPEVLDRVNLRENKTTGPGRPKLGIISREITLLPKHWEWLERQGGGASGSLRKLVERAMADGLSDPKVRGAAAVKFLTAVGGNLPGFEEVSRAFFAGNILFRNDDMSLWPLGVLKALDNILAGPS